MCAESQQVLLLVLAQVMDMMPHKFLHHLTSGPVLELVAQTIDRKWLAGSSEEDQVPLQS